VGEYVDLGGSLMSSKPDNLAETISRLSSRELQTVVSGFADIVREKLAEGYKDDPAALAELVNIDHGQASLILQGLVPALHAEQLHVNNEALRQLLLVLAEQKEFEPYLRPAIERRLLASIDPVVLAPLLVLLLSVKWKLKVKKTKDARPEFEFEISKGATPISFLRALLARVPGWGSGATDVTG
jgi:hypothetical protein